MCFTLKSVCKTLVRSVFIIIQYVLNNDTALGILQAEIRNFLNRSKFEPACPSSREQSEHSLVYLLQVIEEIEEMMQNSPDPEEEEEVLEEEDEGETSSQADSVLLQEMQALTQTFNNNWSYEGEGPGGWACQG